MDILQEAHVTEQARLQEEARRVLESSVESLISTGHLQEGSMIVLGCSTSEVAGARIGKGSVPEYGLIIAQAFLSVCLEHHLQPAFQCCEHLNRAVVMETSALNDRRLIQVNAIPQPKAGGSVPAAAWKLLQHPCLAMAVQAEAAIDVGDTLVGMHVRPVAVPLRGEYSQLGHAHLVMAYSRLPYIGGSRAVYPE
ncbi:MAG: TIGR01440 family protein [Clostridia bacterium]|nr:TIGR01440 family protein [Clostridia bacterium]